MNKMYEKSLPSKTSNPGVEINESAVVEMMNSALSLDRTSSLGS
jgi:hypothetical protein